MKRAVVLVAAFMGVSALTPIAPASAAPASAGSLKPAVAFMVRPLPLTDV